MAHYLDTSALVKLVVAEAESPALLTWLKQQDKTLVSSDLARAELARAVRRSSPDRMVRVRDVLDSITLLTATPETFELAGRLDPSILRTLDAVHLATALSLVDDLDAIVTYDDRLAAAAQANGVPVASPS